MGRLGILRIRDLEWVYLLVGMVGMGRIWAVMDMGRGVGVVGCWRLKMIGMLFSVQGLRWSGLSMAKGSLLLVRDPGGRGCDAIVIREFIQPWWMVVNFCIPDDNWK
jgi:hypothetical protein